MMRLSDGRRVALTDEQVELRVAIAILDRLIEHWQPERDERVSGSVAVASEMAADCDMIEDSGGNPAKEDL